MKYVVDEEYLKQFGENLKAVRKQKGLSQEQLAHKANITHSQITRIERGILNTSISTIRIISKALEIETWEMYKF